MGKNKLARWAELKTFKNVIQPEESFIPGSDHPLKGNWNKEIFGNNNPIVLELGCGKGEYTLGLAVIFPEINFIGIDIKGARMWRGAKTANELQFGNTAFLRTRIEFINSFFSQDEVDEIWLTFPDPHPGKKNSNKRLTCPWFLNIYRNFVKDNGIIHLKTDNLELYSYTRKLATENSLEILAATNNIESLTTSEIIDNGFRDKISKGILSIHTFYESKFLDAGMKINYLAFRLYKNRVVTDGR